uniref:Protein MCM10 homolog n=1 Tax=Tetraodon nigroviridis TaxID=99883 RepID=H3CN65_TETNG
MGNKEGDLDILTELLIESEGADAEEQEANPAEQEEDFDSLFDDDNNGEEEYKESEETVEEEGQRVGAEQDLSELFGDVDDIEEEAKRSDDNKECKTPNKSREDLQEELRRMQEQMQQLQQQLEASQKISSPISPSARTPENPTGPKPVLPKPSRAKGPVKESSVFLDELNTANSFKHKARVAHKPKPSTSGKPFEETSEATDTLRSPLWSQKRPAGPPGPATAPSLPQLPKDVAVEKYSGLRLRRPRVSSSEMERKMAERRAVRLSQLPERLAREKLEDSDWVTFAVLVNKTTQQSNSSGKTFSIWKLNDLHNLDVFVSLLLFGDVHKEHWKTEIGTVVGLLNANPMKQKDGYDGISLTVDNPQKVLLMGEAQDFGTCRGVKKNGEPCSQIVNTFECQYCQYHVKAQYKKMSSKRAELQSSFSGKAPNKVRGGGGGLRERLCQDGFHYGGMSSPACAASLNASRPNKPVQKSLDKLFVKGSAQLIAQAKRLAVQSGEVSGCSKEFRSLMSMPTPGALQLKQHLTQGGQTASKDATGAPLKSISATELLKQQKQKQKELLLHRLRRAGEIQKRVLQDSPGPRPQAKGALMSPKAAREVPEGTRSPAAPTLGRGFSEGEDILFFDKSALSLSAAKMAALKKLKARGTGLAREDPNALKRKRGNSSGISARVEQNLASAEESPSTDQEEPAQKRRREQLLYLQSEEFQTILNAKSRHGAVLQAAEYQLQESYFSVLVKKEQLEEKMRGIREMKCRAVTCKKCSYTYFKPADRCVELNHDLRWQDAVKRFFRCPCGQRAIALDRLPKKHCGNCGLFKWERDGMLKEKTGPKIGGELLLPRGEEHGKFLNSK